MYGEAKRFVETLKMTLNIAKEKRNQLREAKHFSFCCTPNIIINGLSSADLFLETHRHQIRFVLEESNARQAADQKNSKMEG